MASLADLEEKRAPPNTTTPPTPATLSEGSGDETQIGWLENPTTETAPENVSGEKKKDNSARTIHGVKWLLVCASLYVGALIYGLDTTIAADIQNAAVESLGHVEQLTWIGTGFPLGSICAILPAAALYAVFDMKRLFIASITLFEVGSALCGAAPNMNALIIGRVLAGVGGSGVYIGILNYFSACTTDKERGSYMAGIGLVWGLGAILGPVVGGAFSTSSATWRWSFYINLVIAAVCAPVYLIYLPSISPARDSDLKWYTKLIKMDWVGFTLSSVTLVAFVLVLTFAGTRWAWDDHRTIATFVVFGVTMLLTILQQKFYIFTNTEARMFPSGDILKSRSQILLNLETAATVTNIYVPLYYIPIYFQFVHGDTSIMAAVRLLPFILILISFNILGGFALPRVGFYSPLYLVSGILMIIGGSLMYTVTINTPKANIYGFSVLLAVGAGLTFQAAYAIAGVKIAVKGGPIVDVQSAISIVNISQVGGTLLALLISGQVFQSYAFNNLSKVLNNQGFTEKDIHDAVAGAQSTIFEKMSPDLRVLATEAITKAIARVYIVSIAAGAIGLVAALAMKRERLFGMKAPVGG
ncbi:major facilitator superfamily domain-containing protein [Tricladium varicosporioides]|nr:major facilitator superfamily domain-containing protein [Hymenoscyphus varicosporioides]